MPMRGFIISFADVSSAIHRFFVPVNASAGFEDGAVTFRLALVPISGSLPGILRRSRSFVTGTICCNPLEFVDPCGYVRVSLTGDV